MDLAIRVGRYDLVHEIQELSPPPSRVVSRYDLPSGDIEGRKQRCRSVPFVAVTEPVQGLAIRQSKPTLGSLQRLYGRLFHRCTIPTHSPADSNTTHNVCCLRTKLR